MGTRAERESARIRNMAYVEARVRELQAEGRFLAALRAALEGDTPCPRAWDHEHERLLDATVHLTSPHPRPPAG